MTSLFRYLPNWVYRVFKLSPWHYHGTARWEQRTYPCSVWWCFRRSPAWRSFSRNGRDFCDRHLPPIRDDWDLEASVKRLIADNREVLKRLAEDD